MDLASELKSRSGWSGSGSSVSSKASLDSEGRLDRTRYPLLDPEPTFGSSRYSSGVEFSFWSMKLKCDDVLWLEFNILSCDDSVVVETDAERDLGRGLDEVSESDEASDETSARCSLESSGKSLGS